MKTLEENWICLGCRYDLKEDYKDDYDRAFFYVSTDGKIVKVELWSNWNSSYNEVKIIRNFCRPFDAISEFI